MYWDPVTLLHLYRAPCGSAGTITKVSQRFTGQSDEFGNGGFLAWARFLKETVETWALVSFCPVTSLSVVIAVTTRLLCDV